MLENAEYLTREKKEALQAELDQLKNVERRAVAERLEFAKSLGDLSENAEYHEAREEQADLEDRIKKIEQILKTAVIIGKHKGSKVEVGSVVTIKKDGGENFTYTLVGAEEANIAAGKLSFRSPLGSVLLGEEKGATVTVETPRGKARYTILSVE